MLKNYALRRERKGTGVLPPNPNRWEQEHNGLDLRHTLTLPLDRRLPHLAAFDLLPDVHVLSHLELNADEPTSQHFTGARAARWSGMCIHCPEQRITLVVYNQAHGERRVRATLMEEFFHLWLDHPTTHLRMLSDGNAHRDYDGEKESEAYGSGAAALVPYKPLKAMLTAGRTVREIADHFLVSEQLVEFRMRVSKLMKLRRRT